MAVVPLASAPQLSDVAAAMTQSLTEQIGQLPGFSARIVQTNVPARDAARMIGAEFYVKGNVTKDVTIDGDEYFIHLTSFNVVSDLAVNEVMLATPERSTPKSRFLIALFSAPPPQSAQLPVTAIGAANQYYPLIAPAAPIHEPQALIVARWDAQPNGEITDVHDIMAFELPLPFAVMGVVNPSYTRHIIMPVERGSINGVAVDSKGDVYVCREHETPVGVDVYAPGEGVDPVPLRHISVQSPDGRHDCLGIAIDSGDKLYVLNHCCQVVVYPAGAGSDTQPIRRIVDPGARSIAVDSAGKLYLLFPQRVDVFGSAAEIERTFTLSLPTPHTPLSSLAVGPDGLVYVGSSDSVDAYPPGASGSAEPIRRIVVEADRIAIDSHNNLYVLGVDPTKRSASRLLLFNAGAPADAAPTRIVRFPGFPDGIALWSPSR